ncbi:hypothetical protein [Microbispora sp. NPDC049125]|uniref:hypothetical protein n=1 Tax=Microbispora sp. NPDC049125 TaxID=3154929 RepID=UPI00346648B0
MTRWKALSDRQRTVFLILASTEMALTATAVVDLWCRPQAAVRGSKALWWPVIFVQPFGPVVYLWRGRRCD